MKNPHPDKKFFHFFEKILNGQAKDLSLSSSTESVCSQYRAACLEFFHEIFGEVYLEQWKPKVNPNQDAVASSSIGGQLTTAQISTGIVSTLTSLRIRRFPPVNCPWRGSRVGCLPKHCRRHACRHIGPAASRFCWAIPALG